MTDPMEAMRRQLDAIWERSRKEIEARVDAIEGAAIALLDGPIEAAQRDDARREAHKLAGVAGTFGFPNSTTLAREAERILEATRTISPADVARLSAIANALRTELLERGRASADNGAG